MIRRLMLLAALLLAAPLALAQGVLSAGFAGTHASRGAYIDVTATTAVNVTGFAMNLQTGPVTVSVYTKLGSAFDYETVPGAWTLWTTVNVTGKGQGTGTGIAIPSFPIGTGQTYAFYLVADTDLKIFNGCCDSATSSAGNSTVSWISRSESHGLFSITYQGWPFQGAVCYNGGDCGAAAPATPTEIPTLSEWGMIVLSLLVAGLAALHLYRRNRRMTA